LIYVYRNGKLTEKTPEKGGYFRSDFPAPRVSRFETFESPVTGAPISSWRQRERDMNAADAVDRRDIPESTRENRRRIVERNGRTGKAG